MSKYIAMSSLGNKDKKIVTEAIKNKELNAYFINPITNIKTKVPSELASRMAHGEVFTIEEILNFNNLN